MISEAALQTVLQIPDEQKVQRKDCVEEIFAEKGLFSGFAVVPEEKGNHEKQADLPIPSFVPALPLEPMTVCTTALS